MAAAASSDPFVSLRNDIAAGRLRPLYLLHGGEGYYIDRLVEEFENLLPEADRAFNLYQLYAPETSMDTVMEVSRRYPMMADRQVVILKEAQAVSAVQLNKLHSYAERPTESTVLVIVCRGAEAKGKELIAAVKKNGVIFESKKLTDRQAGPAISAIVKQYGLTIDGKGLSMMTDYLGADVAKIYNEVSKLSTILGKGAQITPEVIELNIGISKDYNTFELTDAIAARDVAKAYRIAQYFRSNPKNNPTVLTADAIFKLFSNLLIYHYTRDKSPSGYLDALDLNKTWQLRPYEIASTRYNVRQTIEIISAIRDFDRKTKGVGSRMNEYDLFHDLLFHIFTALGIID